MLLNILQIAGCTLLGLALGTGVILLVHPLIAVGAMAMGFAVALPIMVAAVLVFAFLRPVVLRHLALWCAGAPFLALAIWLVQGAYWGGGLIVMLSGAAVVFVCASISSGLFWYLNRDGADRMRADHGVGV
jgi:hypothetical protein